MSIELKLLFFNSLFIFGWNYATDYDMTTGNELNHFRNALWFVRYWTFMGLISIRQVWLMKPLFTCVICQSSVYGSLGYWLFCPNANLIEWPIYVVVLAGLTRLLKSFA